MTAFYVGAHGLIEKDGKYLVTQRADGDRYMPNRWDLPGGTVEAGEVVEFGLKREIFEESGLSVEVQKPIFVYTTLDSMPKFQVVTIIFLCKFLQGEVVLDPGEHQAFAWKTWAEIRAMDNKIHWLQEMGEKLDVD